MNKTAIRAYTKIAGEAISTSAAALELKLAIGLAVLYETAPAKRLGRETLITIFNAAGMQCEKPGALDWRKVNREITAMVALFDFVGMDDLDQLAAGHKHAELVEAFRPLVAALKVKSVNEVLLATERIRPPKQAKRTEGTRIEAGHIHIVIPPSATPDELMMLASKIMDMVSKSFHQPDAAQPESHEALAGEPA